MGAHTRDGAGVVGSSGKARATLAQLSRRWGAPLGLEEAKAAPQTIELRSMDIERWSRIGHARGKDTVYELEEIFSK